MYTSKNRKLEDIFSESEVANVAKVGELYHSHVLMLKNELEAHYQIMNQTAFLMGPNAFTIVKKADSAILSSIHKGFFLYHSVLSLTTKGFYGPGRTLLRSIFEALVIAKFCNVDETEHLHDRWKAGEYVNLNKDIFNKIKNFETQEMRTFWKGLHELTHATTCSQQITAEFEFIKTELLLNFSLMQMLLSCSYHLISRHWLTPSTVYYAERYGDKESFLKARRVAREISKFNRKNFTEEGKRLLRQYCAGWDVRHANLQVQRANR